MNKPAGQECSSCKPGTGCSVWEIRPRICRDFICLWYANSKFPDLLRPDCCGVLFEPGGEQVMLAGAESSGVWRTGIAWAFIEKCLQEGTAVIVQEPAGGGETNKHFLLPDGDTFEELWARTSKDARQRGFVR